ncbi:MAG: class I SAM-dependent methyltransferase [Clostridiales bacterium]|nr:class I SAM-dependent methyltransferase [Clostridiales bacterium]
MKLSERLSAVAAMVTPGMVLADIGTDHAYIPIALVERDVIPRAIAADVNPGPLKRAAEHIRAHGLADRISTRLCDGLAAFSQGEVQSIVIAGMGGALTTRILQDGKHLFDVTNTPELILQPQSEVSRVRLWLWQNGWEIEQEDMIFEDGKYYPMMKARQRVTLRAAANDEGFRLYSFSDETDAEQGTVSKSADISQKLAVEFGPILLEKRHPVLREYLLKEKTTQERILQTLSSQKSPTAVSRTHEIQGKLTLTVEALKRCQ